MASGTITKWTQGNWGFATVDGGGPDAFVHISNCVDSLEPSVGMRVAFEIITDARTGRKRADNVKAVP